MLVLARVVLVLATVLFAVVGLAGLVSPENLMGQLGLQALSVQGTAEVRGLYGGLFLSWSAILIAAWRSPALRGGLLLALAATLGLIALARVVSMAVDGDFAFNLPALAGEAVIALACWAVARSGGEAQA